MATLVCRSTGNRYPVDMPIWRSESGGMLDLEFAPSFDLERIKSRPPTLWRYREALPINHDENIVTLGEGFSPLVPARIAGRKVLLKQEQLFPSGSFKDRGASVLVSKVRELGIRRVVEDSSGNAGAAIAAYCARAGIACDIYAPASNSPAKLAQIRHYGANLHPIPGSREDVAAAAMKAAEEHYYASHVWNPFFFQGTKTFAYEIAEQLGWQSPDAVIVPVGNGTLLLGAFIGFRELRAAGMIDRLPRLIGVQAAGCSPLYAAWTDAEDRQDPASGQGTLAEGIAIREPARAEQCVQAVRETDGRYVVVDDDEITAALSELARAGMYVEPTAAAAVAAIGKCEVEGTLVVPLTGHGLKSAR